MCSCDVLLARDKTLGSQLNATQYLGTWYQMASSLLVNATFERDSCCVRAQYGLYPNGTVSVHNTAKIGSPDGKDDNILGWAQAEDPSKPAQLTVHLQGVPFGAPCKYGCDLEASRLFPQ